MRKEREKEISDDETEEKKGEKKEKDKMRRRSPRVKKWTQMRRRIVLRISKKKQRKLRRNADWESLNKTKPIGVRRNPDDITQEKYGDFYKSFTNEWKEHLEVKHFSVESQLKVMVLLFKPCQAPFGFFEKKNIIKLSVHHVFIMDSCDQRTPEYFIFTQCAADSEDLPLDISQELLQQSKLRKVVH